MRRCSVIIGLAVLAGAVVGIFLSPSQPRPCRATFERVRERMTREEVCAIVGGQPGDYTDGQCLHRAVRGMFRGPPEGEEMWAAADATLRVRFDGDRAAEIEIDSPVLINRPLLAPFRDRLGL
jgi:hypothetical protein